MNYMAEAMLKGKIIICSLAEKNDVPEPELRREMHQALEQIWGQAAECEELRRLFPEGKPSLEMFIIRIAELFQ